MDEESFYASRDPWFLARMAHVNAFGEVSRSRRGRERFDVVAIIVAVCLLSLSDALVKLAGDRLALGQLLLLRSALAGFLLALVAGFWSQAPGLRPLRPGWVTVRSLCLTAMWVLYYAALPQMSFAVAAAGFYTAPLWMALLASLLLGQRMGPVRWLALGIGLAGILVLLRPGPEAVSLWFALPVGAALCYALAGIITWHRLEVEPALAMAFNLNAVLAIAGAVWMGGVSVMQPAGGAFLTSLWRDVSQADAVLIGMLAVFLAVIAVLVATAYRSAPAPLVGMFDNGYLVFATIWGILFFGDVPGLADCAGLLLIGSAAALMASAGRQEPAGAVAACVAGVA